MTDAEKKHLWYLAHADEVKARSKQWAIDNPEKAKEANKKKSQKYEEANRIKRREKSKAYYLKNKEKSKEAGRRYYAKYSKTKYRAYSRKYHYGLTQEQFESMLREQEGKCAICFDILETPFVDHDHNTNKIRQLLCKKCNSFIGLANESPDILMSAIRYIQKHKQ